MVVNLDPPKAPITSRWLRDEDINQPLKLLEAVKQDSGDWLFSFQKEDGTVVCRSSDISKREYAYLYNAIVSGKTTFTYVLRKGFKVPQVIA